MNPIEDQRWLFQSERRLNLSPALAAPKRGSCVALRRLRARGAVRLSVPTRCARNVAGTPAAKPYALTDSSPSDLPADTNAADVGTDPTGSVATEVERALGYRFNNPALLETAFTHRSYCAEHPQVESNERLEFLGDSVLGLAITLELYARFPDRPEGSLAKMRASIVNAESLAAWGDRLGIGAALRLGRGEERSGGRLKESIISDAVEAVIGAMYLDGGFQPARTFVLQGLSEQVHEAGQGPGAHDYKTRLQELAAREWGAVPEYRVKGSGPDHERHYVATVDVAGLLSGTGTGPSKKRAQQRAAAQACRHYRDLADSGEFA